MATNSTMAAKVADFLVGLGILLMVGLADYVTGYKISILVLYLAPIWLVLKRLGPAAAWGMAILAGVVWLLAALAAHGNLDNVAALTWNAFMRVLIFVLFVNLASMRQQLEALVQQRTEKLQQEIKERTRLEQALLAAGEREKRRIGQDLHDSLGQHLTATALAGKMLAKRLGNEAREQKGAADQLVRMVEEGIDLTRKLAHDLHPVDLEAGSFIPRLQALAAHISRTFGVSCRFECPQFVTLNDPETNLNIYRIVQEAVSNAIRHGQAKHIEVRLEPAGPEVRLTIMDDGTGLGKSVTETDGMGMRIMKYRAKTIGASFSVTNLPDGGALVSCNLPSI